MVSIGVKGGGYSDQACLTCPARPRMLCSGLADDELPDLSAISSKVKLKKSETLFFEGDDTKYVYNVIEGYLRLSRLGLDGRRQIMGFLTTGDYLGHTRREHFTISAEALTDVHVCRYERDGLEELLHKHPKFELQFNQLTAGLLDDMLDLVFTLGRKNAIERVSSFLVHSLERQAHSDGIVYTLWLPMTRSDIADFLGLTLETVSRAFSKLKKEGIIDIEHAHTIHVRDRSTLIDIATGDDG